MRFFGKSIVDALSSTISGGIQRRLINYALRRLLGSYVRRELSADDLNLRLQTGVLSFTDLDLRIESINDKLQATGYMLESGCIDLLQISIPWSDMLSGKVSVLIQGVRVTCRLSSGSAKRTDHLDVEQAISESIANMTESFLGAESQYNVGVSEELPEAALLQRMLDTILSNLTIEIRDLSVQLNTTCIRHSLLLELSSVNCNPHCEGIGREVLLRELDFYLIKRTHERTIRGWQEHSDRSASSRSTSSSSYGDSGMMKSTIFGLDEGRSLYMSAMSTPHDAEQSAISDDVILPSRHKRRLLTSAGFSGVVIQNQDLIHLDISGDDLKLQVGLSEIIDLIPVMRSLLPGKSQSTTKVDQDSRFDLTLRVSSLHFNVDLRENLDLSTATSSAACTTRLELLSRRITLELTRDGLSLDIPYLDMKAGESTLVSASSKHFGLFTFNHTSGTRGQLQPLVAKIHLTNMCCLLQAWYDLQTSIIAEEQSPVETPGIHTEALSATVPAFRCSCSETEIRWVDCDQSPVLKCHDLDLHWSSGTARTRTTLTFGMLQLKIANTDIADLICTESCNVIDFTVVRRKPSQTTLEFIKYDTLFEHPERDYKTESSTLKLLKQKAKDNADHILRASLGELRFSLDRQGLIHCIESFDSLQKILANINIPSVPSQDKYNTTATILGELSLVTLILNCGTDVIRVSLHRGSFFLVNNLKSITAVSLDLSTIQIVSNVLGIDTKIVNAGLHTEPSSSKTRSNQPMFSVRVRQDSLSGLTSGTMIRLGLTDIQVEYSPEMLWLDSCLKLYRDICQVCFTKTGTKVTSIATARIALDLTNTSIGLNPFSGKSKALLYFRRSAAQGHVPISPEHSSMDIHAGVMDLFLIDDIDGPQNDTSSGKRIRNDPVAFSLTRLGFVKVASAETVEITLRLEQSEDAKAQFAVDVVGAILTMGMCADSMATLTTLLSLLRLPIVLADELKYKLGVALDGNDPLDIFADIDNEAFKTAESGVGLGPNTGSMPVNSSHFAETGSIDAVFEGNYDDNMAAINRTSNPDSTVLNIAGKNVTSEDNSTTAVLDDYFMSQSILDIRKDIKSLQRVRQHKLLKIATRKCFVILNLHDGYDWEHTRSSIMEAVDKAIVKAQQKSDTSLEHQSFSYTVDSEDDDDDVFEMGQSDEVGDLLFNSIYISFPQGAQPEDITKSINQELAQADASDTATQTTATQAGRVIQASQGQNSLQLGRSKMHKVRLEASGIDMALELLDAKEGEVLSTVDLKVKDIEILDNVSTSTWRKFMTYHRGAGPRDPASHMAQIKVTSVRPIAGLAAAELVIEAVVSPIRLHVDQDTLEFLTRFLEFKDPEAVLSIPPAEEIFLQKFEIQAIPLQIDYKPRRVDYRSLRSGRTTELKNFFILEDSNMILKHVVLYGVSGFTKVFAHLNDIWLAHIKSTQLSSVLAGVSPIRSLASFGGGLKNLVMMPISEYKKDGRIVPGLKKGIDSFVRSTGKEAIRLGAKLAVGTQGILETAEHTLGHNREDDRHNLRSHAVSMYADQPRDLKQGLSQAFGGMTKNVALAKEALISVPKDLEEETDAVGAARVAAKSIPVAVLRPLIGTTEMISKTLLGLRNSMDPEQRHLNNDKYKHHN